MKRVIKMSDHQTVSIKAGINIMVIGAAGALALVGIVLALLNIFI